MKVSESWLREWVNPETTTQQLAAQLTMAGLEVDSVTPVAGQFSHVVVAKVLEAKPHPEADKLSLCVVDCGQGAPLQIVCGASNVRTGLTVALAMIGATLPNGMTIKETRLRGQLSQGMLCSAAELGMMDQIAGIIELPDDAPIGTDLREYMGLNDVVLDIDLTPNRADCFSVFGIAREVAALNQSPLRSPKPARHQPTHDDTKAVHLAAPKACPLYYGRMIRQINPHAETPLWLTERLRRAGIRSIHPVVDVLNYVMIELGQPMHAYDVQMLEGDLHVRYSKDGETLSLLDAQTVTLSSDTLLIADNSKPLAIAGIMGGGESAVHTDTTDVFLESAFFNPKLIAGVARRYGLCTESSQRFERGVDPAIPLLALDYATDLILSIVGGQVGPAHCAQSQDDLPVPKQLLFHPQQVQQLTGVSISEEDMALTLRGLGLTANTTVKPWAITVPSHRFDIELDVDIVEEVIRIYGYDKIIAQPMQDILRKGAVHPLEELSQHMGVFLSGRGYHELISYSFVDPEIQAAIYPDSQAMALLNPISSELSQMRVGLWPGLLASAVYNSHRQQPMMKLFESGVVFDLSSGALEERPCIAGLMSGEWSSLNWSELTRSLDFYDLKGDVQALLSGLTRAAVSFVPGSHPGLHPGKSAQIMVDGHAAGWIGVLHPRLADDLSLTDEVILFELNLAPLISKTVPQYKKISRFPSVRRDLSFLIDKNVSASQIEAAVRDVVSADRLKSFDVFDVYLGESIPADKKSLAIALTLQDGSRTLVDDDIQSMIEQIIAKLNQDFAITLRD